VIAAITAKRDRCVDLISRAFFVPEQLSNWNIEFDRADNEPITCSSRGNADNLTELDVYFGSSSRSAFP
jgi:hypothetical protein